MKISVIGDKDFALGFRLSGIKKLCESNETNYVQNFESCFEDPEMGIIIIEERYFKKLPARLKKKIEKVVSPVIVSISGEEVGGTDIGAMIKRSLGVDLWKQEKS